MDVLGLGDVRGDFFGGQGVPVFVPDHQVLFESGNGDGCVLAVGVFQLVAAFAEFFFVLRTFFDQTIIFDRPPPMQMAPVPANGFQTGDDRAAVRPGAETLRPAMLLNVATLSARLSSQRISATS